MTRGVVYTRGVHETFVAVTRESLTTRAIHGARACHFTVSLRTFIPAKHQTHVFVLQSKAILLSGASCTFETLLHMIRFLRFVLSKRLGSSGPVIDTHINGKETLNIKYSLYKYKAKCYYL